MNVNPEEQDTKAGELESVKLDAVLPKNSLQA